MKDLPLNRERNVYYEQFRFKPEQKNDNNNGHQEVDNRMFEKKTEAEITMLTIKEAAALVDGLTEYRVREMCRSGELPCLKAGKKYLINKAILIKFLGGEPE